MKISRWPMKNHFNRQNPAQGVSERRMFQARNAVVGNHHAIAAQFIKVALQKLCQMAAAHFLLALDHKRQIARKLRVRLEISLHSIQMREVLALVIRGAAREEVAALNPRLKWWRFPQLKRL